jgi:hypothetical protein
VDRQCHREVVPTVEGWLLLGRQDRQGLRVIALEGPQLLALTFMEALGRTKKSRNLGTRQIRVIFR